MKYILALCIIAFSFSVSADDEFAGDYMSCKVYEKWASKPESACMYKTSKEFCDRFQAFPADIQKVINLNMHCHFLGGELGGEPKLDMDIYKAVEKLGCDETDSSSISALRKHWGQPEIAKAVVFFEEEYEKANNLCLK